MDFNKEESKVTKEDQKYINEFSRLHQKRKLLENNIKQLNEKIENYKDCLNAIDELFGENAKIMVGETFIEMSDEFARERVEKINEDTKKQKKEYEEKLYSNIKRLDELKIILYSKFKNSINLDE